MVLAYIVAAVIAIVLIVTAFERDPMDNALTLDVEPQPPELVRPVLGRPFWAVEGHDDDLPF